MDGSSIELASRSPTDAPLSSVDEKVCISPGPSSPPGTDGVSLSLDSSRETTQETIPEGVQVTVVPEAPVVGLPRSPRRLVSPLDSAVEKPPVALDRGPDCISTSSSGDVHGRLVCGVGSPYRLRHGRRNVVHDAGDLAHQPPRAGGSVLSSSGVSHSSVRPTCVALHGQHNSCLLRQQAGGGAFPSPLDPRRAAHLVVPQPPDTPFSPTCARQGQRLGGLSESPSHGPSDGVDAVPPGSPASVGPVVPTSCRSVRHHLQPQAASLRLSSLGPGSLGNRRSLHSVDRPPRVRLSSLPDPGEGDQESAHRGGVDDSGGTTLAGPAVVPRSTAAGSARPAHQAQARPQVSPAAEIRHPPRQSGNAGPPRLASVRESLSALGASEDVVNLVCQSHRPGTQGVYSSHWNRWIKWCKDNTTDPRAPTRIQLANFLASLSSAGMSASSVKVHRAAISSTISQLGGTSFSDDPILRAVVRATTLKEARSPRRAPSWDLFLVLAYLRTPPFEPLRDLSFKLLSLKTCFLIALASGRRCSEVHGLSGLPSDIARESDGSYSLRFLPDFLAKNQVPGDPSPTVSIRPLTSILNPDDEDRFLCPVRALRLYLRRSRPHRSQKRRLFISWNLDYRQDIRKSSLSRWLVEVIRAAYARSGTALEDGQARAHEVRAWASTLAFSHTRRLQSVLDAAYWRSPGTFLQFYLRDTARLREDGSHGISSTVVAQQVLSVTSHR